MKTSLASLIFLGFCISIYAQSNSEPDTLSKTKYFSFHNNKWMNLHHFFYEKASNRQLNHLADDNISFLKNEDSLAISLLNQDEKKLMNEGIRFYEANMINRNLLNSGNLLKWLQTQDTHKNITDTTFTSDFTKILNRLNPLYEQHFWKRHQEQNQVLLNNYIELIETTEDFVIQKMESLSGSNWTGIVRIDLTTYGNWASAYSPDFDNIVVSSIDPLMHSSIFIEFVFHESSHLLFLRKSPFRRSLFEKSEELGIPYPRNLWHAAMFYLSGIATEEALQKQNKSHELIMKKKKVFKTYYDDSSFREILQDYYNSKIDLEITSTQLLKLN